MRNVFIVLIVLAVTVLMSGCLTGIGGTSQQAVDERGPIIETSSISQVTPVAMTYCRVKIADKCKGLDGANDKFFLIDGAPAVGITPRQVEVASECATNYCTHSLYSRVTIGQEYVLGMTGGIVVKVYTIQEATESCELRLALTGVRCGV